MKNKINYSQEAFKDLNEIEQYIANDLDSPTAAINIVTHIMDTIDLLSDFAESGALLSSIIDIESNYRFLVSGNYLVFYRINHKDIYIDRILYNKRNYMNILFNDLPISED